MNAAAPKPAPARSPARWPTVAPVNAMLVETVTELLTASRTIAPARTPLAFAVARLGTNERHVLLADESDAATNPETRFPARDLAVLRQAACWPVVVDLARNERNESPESVLDVEAASSLLSSLKRDQAALRSTCERVIRDEPGRTRDYLAFQLMLQRAEANWQSLVRESRGEASVARVALVALDEAVVVPGATLNAPRTPTPATVGVVTIETPVAARPRRMRPAHVLAATAFLAVLVHVVAFDALGWQAPRAETIALPGEQTPFPIRRAHGLGTVVVPGGVSVPRIATALARAAGCPVRLVDAAGRSLGTADADHFSPPFDTLARQASTR